MLRMEPGRFQREWSRLSRWYPRAAATRSRGMPRSASARSVLRSLMDPARRWQHRDLARIDLIIIDDWALAPIDAAQARDFLEILDDRFGHRSAIITSQLPVADWHRQVKDPSVADAILDRLVHGAVRFELTGSSMRNPTTCEPSSTAGGQHPPA